MAELEFVAKIFLGAAIVALITLLPAWLLSRHNIQQHLDDDREKEA